MLRLLKLDFHSNAELSYPEANKQTNKCQRRDT